MIKSLQIRLDRLMEKDIWTCCVSQSAFCIALLLLCHVCRTHATARSRSLDLERPVAGSVPSSVYVHDRLNLHRYYTCIHTVQTIPGHVMQNVRQSLENIKNPMILYGLYGKCLYSWLLDVMKPLVWNANVFINEDNWFLSVSHWWTDTHLFHNWKHIHIPSANTAARRNAW